MEQLSQQSDFYIKFPLPGTKMPQGSKVKYLKAFTVDWNEQLLAGYGHELRKFAAGKLGENEPIGLLIAGSRLIHIAHPLRHKMIHSALSDEPDWRQAFDHATAYQLLGFELHACHYLYKSVAASGKVWGGLDFSGMLSNIVHCLVAGWTDQAAGQARLLLRAYKWNCVMSYGYLERTQLFVLRILADWQGMPNYLKKWPKWAYNEPLFVRLLEIWRTPDDIDELTHLLLVACDRRTHQCSSSYKKHYDLRHMWQWYDPFEIMAVLKLRELAGLKIPILSHPLMDSPLGRLHESSVVYDDKLLASVRARSRALHPDVGPECCSTSS